jgi:predicted RNA methylase
MQRPETREARARKRADGVFYTPADVADYMAGLVLPGVSWPKPPVLLDLACGTGVFLRAALKRFAAVVPRADIAALALTSLHGVDIDLTALNGAAFTLLHDCGGSATASTPPVQLWRSLRANLLRADALSLDPGRSAHIVPMRKGGSARRSLLGDRFPALAGGADVVMGNPPYADIGQRDDFAVLARVFETIAAVPTPKADLYPVFVEQMIRLSAPTAAGSLVLPLSIACNGGAQFVALRRLVARTSGTWRFAFFDRQPHALFGEDVKTRNAIVAWECKPEDVGAQILTGPLTKWRAQARAAMFERISFTPLSVPVASGIPKISGLVQSKALLSLSGRAMKLSGAVLGFGRRAPVASVRNRVRPTVFVGATAYNFLNVFREVTTATPDGLTPTSHHPHALECVSERDARAVLALLASGTAFWWWHVHDDGFHVSRSTLGELPVGIDVLAGSAGDELAEIGADIWASAKKAFVVSNNGGKASFAFPPSSYATARVATDRVLRRALGLPAAFEAELNHFLHDVISAGGGSRAHQHGETNA